MATPALHSQTFSVERDGQLLAGEVTGEGPPVVLLHGITATRRYVVHGSNALPRAGHSTISYDARGHGESAPAPAGSGYTYPELIADLAAVLEARVADRRPVIAGHSMGAHTVVAHALEAGEVAGIVVICPAFAGVPPSDEVLERWDELADGLEGGGVEGFLRVYERHGLNPEWRETLIRITRERLEAQRHPDALARAMRELPRSQPFEDLAELEFLDLPALVVASRDEADPGHPRAVAEEYARRLPSARLVGEGQGEPPLAWQGGRLSREIAAFCDEPAVRERLR